MRTPEQMQKRREYAKAWRLKHPEYRREWGKKVKSGEHAVAKQARVPYSGKGWNKWIERYPEKYAQYRAKTKGRRAVNKIALVEMFGGKCQICGFSSYIGALEFDHIDPATKSFSISQWIHRDFNKCVEEAKKCRLLCANCHREHGARPKLDKYNVLQ